MKKLIWTVLGSFSLLVALAVFGHFWTPVQAQEGKEPTLVGSWDVRVTIRDCGTGQEFFSFPAMLTFNQGGTMEESDLGGPGIVRLAGHGVWKRQAAREFSAAYRWLNFLPDRTFLGSQVVRSSMTLDRSGDSFTATDTGTVIDANGNESPGGCATEAGTRFQ